MNNSTKTTNKDNTMKLPNKHTHPINLLTFLTTLAILAVIFIGSGCTTTLTTEFDPAGNITRTTEITQIDLDAILEAYEETRQAIIAVEGRLKTMQEDDPKREKWEDMLESLQNNFIELEARKALEETK